MKNKIDNINKKEENKTHTQDKVSIKTNKSITTSSKSVFFNMLSAFANLIPNIKKITKSPTPAKEKQKSILTKYKNYNKNKSTSNNNIKNKDNKTKDKQNLSDSNCNYTKLNILYTITMVLTFCLVASSFFIKIEQTININGQVIPSKNIANLRHETGGIIEKLHVNNYDRVNKGDPIMSLNDTKYTNSLINNKSKLKVIDSEIINSLAFLKNNISDIQEQSIISEVESYLNNIPDTISHTKQLAEASKSINDHKDEVILNKISQNKINIKRLNTELKILNNELKHLDEQRNIFNKLLETRNVSKVRALDYEIKYSEALRESRKLEAEIMAKNKETEELESKRIVQKQDAIKTKYESLIELNKQKLDIMSNISQLQDSIKKLKITAPISGTIQGVNIVEGSSIQAGELILSIIPDDSEVLFEAKASLSQRAKVGLSSNAEIQFDGFNALRFDRVNGKVINISPYTFDKNPMENEFSKIIVKLNSNKIKSKNKEFNIQLGISGTAYITTEKQSLFAYIFGPIYGSFTNAHGANG